jgi:hypothetical protein
MEQRVHRNLDIFKDPLFWGTMMIGMSPIILGGAFLVWLH